MAYTMTQLEALEAALASGELTVAWEGRSVTYRSVKELREAIATVRAALEQSGALSSGRRRTYAAYSPD